MAGNYVLVFEIEEAGASMHGRGHWYMVETFSYYATISSFNFSLYTP